VTKNSLHPDSEAKNVNFSDSFVKSLSYVSQSRYIKQQKVIILLMKKRLKYVKQERLEIHFLSTFFSKLQ
jgi:hypothetical protein